jgi:hypothetical protein
MDHWFPGGDTGVKVPSTYEFEGFLSKTDRLIREYPENLKLLLRHIALYRTTMSDLNGIVHFTGQSFGSTTSAFVEQGLQRQGPTEIDEAGIYVFTKKTISMTFLTVINFIHTSSLQRQSSRQLL